MNISILQENLLRALVTIGRIVSPRPQLPVLQNALIRTLGGRIQLVATSLDVTEVAWCDGKIVKEGAACVSAKLLGELISSLPAEAVVLTEKEGTLAVASGGVHASLSGVDVAEFPPVPTTGKEKTSTVDKETLAATLSLVLFAAASDEARPVLSGLQLIASGSLTTITATDGYRLSRKEAPIQIPDKTTLIISARALSEVMRLCRENKAATSLTVAISQEGQLAFTIGDTELFTRRIDGEFPAVDKIIPTKWTTRVTLDRESLHRAVKSAAIFARDSANIVRFRIDSNLLTVSANAPTVGENTVDVEVKTEGEGGEIAFNSRFLLDFLAACPGEEVVFEMTGSLNPGVFKIPQDESFLHIIMPVRVQG